MSRVGVVIATLFLWSGILVPAPTRGADADHPLNAHLTERFTSDLDAMVERRYIRVLTTYNRTNFFLDGGAARGFEYALLKEYQKRLNKKINRRSLKVVFEFIAVSRERLIPDLVDGYGDIAAPGLTITLERAEKVDFTRAYLTGIDEVLVAHQSVGTVPHLTDLAGRRIFVRRRSSYYHSLRALNQRCVSAWPPSMRDRQRSVAPELSPEIWG